jgi:hypothetical protein
MYSQYAAIYGISDTARVSGSLWTILFSLSDNRYDITGDTRSLIKDSNLISRLELGLTEHPTYECVVDFNVLRLGLYAFISALLHFLIMPLN